MPTRRSGQNTSGASSKAVRAVESSSSPKTSRSPTLTATRATPSVASSSRTSADMNAMRSVAIAERRWAAPSSAMRPAGPVGAAERAQRGDAGDQVQHPRLQRGHRAQRRRRTVCGDQADEHHEERYQRERDHHDDGRLQVVVRHDHDRGRGEHRGQDHRRQVCGEVRPQPVESARRQERGIVSRGGESPGWKRRHRGEYAFVQLGDDCRRTTLAEPGLPPLGDRSNHPRPAGSTASAPSVRPCAALASVTMPATSSAIRTARRDRAAGDDHAASTRRDQVAPHRGGGGEALHVTRGDRPIGFGDARRPRSVAGTPNTSMPGSRSPVGRRSVPPRS